MSINTLKSFTSNSFNSIINIKNENNNNNVQLKLTSEFILLKRIIIYKVLLYNYYKIPLGLKSYFQLD